MELEELILLHAVWFPTGRFNSNDPFLTDLRIGHERGVFPVYFDRLPASDAVASIGAVQIAIPITFLDSGHSRRAARWRLSLLKIAKLALDEAKAALHDLPNIFEEESNAPISSTKTIEVHLFEFTEINYRVFHPVFLIKE